MSGLNAIEMSSLTQSRRTHAYRRADSGPDCDEPKGTGPAQGHGPGVAGAEDAVRGSSAGGPVGPPDPTDSAEPEGAGRCRPGPWSAGQAFEPEVPSRVSSEDL